MARRGENIRKRKDGRWEGRYIVFIANEKKMSSVYAETYAEVKNKLTVAKLTANRKGAVTVSPSGIAEDSSRAIREIASEWLINIYNTRKYSTYIKYKNIYNKYLSEIKELKITELSENNIKKKLTFLNIQDSALLKDSVIGVLNQIIKYGNHKYGYHCELLERIKSPGKRKNIEIFNTMEQHRLFHVLSEDTDNMKKGILICLFTGLRLGEICALKWSDIDFDLNILHVTSTVQRIAADGYNSKTILYESAPKSECSKREIPLSDPVIQILKSIPVAGKYIIKGSAPVEPRTYECRLQKYLETADIANKNFHTLRHTFATNCIESGMDVKSLSEILGHADVQITLNKYVHPTLETKRHHMNNLTSIYGQFMGQRF